MVFKNDAERDAYEAGYESGKAHAGYVDRTGKELADTKPPARYGSVLRMVWQDGYDDGKAGRN